MEAKPFFCYIQLNSIKWLIHFDLTGLRFIWARTHEETERYHARNQPGTFVDRLKVAAYLNSVAFRYDINNPPRLNRTAFSARKHQNG